MQPEREQEEKIGLDDYGIRKTKGSLNFKLFGKGFHHDKWSIKRVASKTDYIASGQLGCWQI